MQGVMLQFFWSAGSNTILFEEIHFVRRTNRSGAQMIFKFVLQPLDQSPVPQLQMPCPLPRIPMNAHCACKLASSVAPRADAEDSVSVIGYAAPTGF